MQIVLFLLVDLFLLFVDDVYDLKSFIKVALTIPIPFLFYLNCSQSFYKYNLIAAYSEPLDAYT